MVSRVYVEKKPGFDIEAAQLGSELRSILGIDALQRIRIVNRYDVEGISRELFEACIPTVFSEPTVDFASEDIPKADDSYLFAVEYLPGQFDQRADSASECIQLISQGERPLVRSAKLYILEGSLDDADIDAIKRYLINPVESREASLDICETLAQVYPEPDPVERILGFRSFTKEQLDDFLADRGLAMDHADLRFCQDYFRKEGRDPSITEIKVVDTYWSDHCRHTTFNTRLDFEQIADARVQQAYERYLAMRDELGRSEKPICLMDMGTIGARYLQAKGIQTGVDKSDEVNACTVKIRCDVNGKDEDWLYLFKNETHNHPTEIEPFGGAATCVGGAIRDPLSGRSYVYQAMRVTGAGDPLLPVSETLEGKLPQRKLVTTAAAGYSSYGNQIGLATGRVDELYHPGYVAKRMEIGAVVGAAPASHVRREEPQPGDVVVLLGGRTGRDGIGGATGSSKAHKLSSLETCGAEVQKGNAPVERKLQRLFRREDACKLIKRCNDFGAGGVSVAIGELADGLDINLDAVPKKYDGLDGTELAISESQERMAVALDAADLETFIGFAHEENLEATVVAQVTEEPRVRMHWRGDDIVDISREFLASNGAPKDMSVRVPEGGRYAVPWREGSFTERMAEVLTNLNVCSNKGLVQRFDSTIGAATVLMPFGGKRQLTPAQAMVAKLPVFGETTTCSGMAWGFNPYLSEVNQYEGAYAAVVESVSKLLASGFSRKSMYLTFQEYFERLRTDARRWGKPAAALLGSLMAQVDLGIGSIGGKDSMSGSFEDLDVPPTLVSFATAIGSVGKVLSPEFKQAGSRVLMVRPHYSEASVLPETESMVGAFDLIERLSGQNGETPAACAVSALGFGCGAEALFKMCVGNGLGIRFDAAFDTQELFVPRYGSFIIELAKDAALPESFGAFDILPLGVTTQEYAFETAGERIDLAYLQELWESKLEPVYPYRGEGEEVETVSYRSGVPLTYCGSIARPRVVIPVFPGNNCEYDCAQAFEKAGAAVTTYVVNNLTPDHVAQSTKELASAIRESQIIMLPGGFSGGDEPDGSAKFITAFFRAPEVTEAVRDLLQVRDGLILGICNGFQALIKLGLVPFGDIRDMDENCPTLTFNSIGRHQSSLVRTRVASNLSPWLSRCQVGDVHTLAISHGEGRFVATPEMLAELKQNGQIATQYVDERGVASMCLDVNPNGSLLAIEGITSPDGRVLGKMGHSERTGSGLYRNVAGNIYQPLFQAGVDYFL